MIFNLPLQATQWDILELYSVEMVGSEEWGTDEKYRFFGRG